VNILTRLVAASGLAALALAVPALAEDVAFKGPDSATGDYLAGQQALTELRTHEAASFFRTAAAGQWTNPLVVDRAFVALAADGQIDDAADMAKHILELEPDNDMAKLVLATQAFKQRRYDAAVAGLAQLDAQTFEGVTGSILKAWALTGQNKVDEASKALDALADGGL